MITMEMFGKVRRMFYRDGMSRSEIAKRTGLSRTTVQKWVKAPAGSAPKYQRAGRPSKLTPYKDELLQALKADARRPRRERRTALKLLSLPREVGLHPEDGKKITSNFGRSGPYVYHDGIYASLPRYLPELEKYWLSVVNINQTGNIDEFGDRRYDALWLDDCGELGQALVGHFDDPDRRINGAEGVIFRSHAGFGQRVEKSGFADIRQTDDSTFETHGEVPEKTKLGHLDVQRALRCLIVTDQ